MATIADVFSPEDRVTVTYSDFYRIIENSCSQAAALMYIKNAIDAGVPNNYIRSMLDGQKHWDELYTSSPDLNSLHYDGPYYGTMEETEELNGNS